MGKLLVQCGASEEARAGRPPAPRSNAPPVGDPNTELPAVGGAGAEAAAEALPMVRALACSLPSGFGGEVRAVDKAKQLLNP